MVSSPRNNRQRRLRSSRSKHSRAGAPFRIHALLVDRKTIVELGGFDVSLRTCEDWDLWQRVARRGKRWVMVDEPLAFYRTSPNSLTRNSTQMLADAEIVIARGFSADPGSNSQHRLTPMVRSRRTAAPLPKHSRGSRCGTPRRIAAAAAARSTRNPARAPGRI